MNDELIKTALLGTDKYPVQTPLPLATLANSIQQQQEDKEGAFLQLAAASFTYEASGKEYPIHPLPSQAAPLETLEYASYDFNAALRAFIKQNDPIMLRYALSSCAQKQLLVAPDLIPTLLQQTTPYTNTLTRAVCGERGRWLAALNPQWSSLYTNAVSTDEWETASFDTRKELLRQLRVNAPEKAVALIDTSFQQESAQKRLELLECFSIQPGLYDEAFLTGLKKDRSSKVKELAFYYLKYIPGSEVHALFLDFLAQTLQLQEEPRLLISKKKVLKLATDVQPSQELLDAGLEKISSQKGFSDHWFWAMQCLEVAPPDWIRTHYGEEPSTLLKRLLAQPNHALLVPHLIRWAIHYKQSDLALQLTTYTTEPHHELADTLRPVDAVAYRLLYLKQHTENIVKHLIQKEEEFPEALAIELMKLLKQHPHNLTAATYRTMALYFPLSLKRALDALANRIGDGHFDLAFLKNQVVEMVRILELREHMNL